MLLIAVSVPHFLGLQTAIGVRRLLPSANETVPVTSIRESFSLVGPVMIGLETTQFSKATIRTPSSQTGARKLLGGLLGDLEVASFLGVLNSFPGDAVCSSQPLGATRVFLRNLLVGFKQAAPFVGFCFRALRVSVFLILG